MVLTPMILIKIGAGLTCGGIVLALLIILSRITNPKRKSHDS